MRWISDLGSRRWEAGSAHSTNNPGLIPDSTIYIYTCTEPRTHTVTPTYISSQRVTSTFARDAHGVRSNQVTEVYVVAIRVHLHERAPAVRRDRAHQEKTVHARQDSEERTRPSRQRIWLHAHKATHTREDTSMQRPKIILTNTEPG